MAQCSICSSSFEDESTFCNHCGQQRYPNRGSHIERDLDWLLNAKADYSHRQEWYKNALKDVQRLIQYTKVRSVFHFQSWDWFRKKKS